MFLAYMALLLFPLTKEASPPTLCGIQLSPSSLTLFHDVETRLGRTVRCETHLEFGILGASDVTADGTPEVILDSYEGKTEENLVHELFHLQLHAKGFPQHFQVKSSRTTDNDLLQQVAEQLGSLVEHRIFYPEMLRMGLDPTLQYRQALEFALTQGKLYGIPLAEKRTLTYAEVSLLVHDSALTRKVEQWYVRQGWTDQLNRGKRLTRYLTTYNPDTPEKKRVAVAACLEIVFGHKFDLTWLP